MPRIVFINGDYGVGKTTFVNYFLDNLHKQDRSKKRIIKSKCTTNDVGYNAFSSILSSLYENNNNKLFKKKFLHSFTVTAPVWITLIPKVGVLFAALATTFMEIANYLPKKIRPQEVNNQYSKLLSELSINKPLVIFIDDFHLADDSSINLLYDLGRNLQNCPVLIIIASRPIMFNKNQMLSDSFGTIKADLIEKCIAVNIEFDKGTNDKGINVKDYVDSIYCKNNFSPSFIEYIQKHTRGFPLYINLLFKLWEEMGIIYNTHEGDKDDWRNVNDDIINLPIPENVGEIIRARYQKFTSDQQKILKYASIIGEEFIIQIIEQMIKASEQVFFENIEYLEKKYYTIEYENLLTLNRQLFDVYRFTHEYIRSIIYETICPTEQRSLHLKVAQLIEKMFSTNKSINEKVLVDQFSKAYEWKKAAYYSLQASIQECNRFSWREGVKCCQKGLEYLNQSEEWSGKNEIQICLLIQAGDCQYHIGNFAEANIFYHEAMKVINRSKKYYSNKISVNLKIIDTLWYENKNSEIPRYIKITKNLIEKIGYKNQLDINTLDAHEAFDYIHKGDNEKALEMLKSVYNKLTSKSTYEYLYLKSRVCNWIAIAYSNQSNFSLSAEYYKKSIDIAKKISEKNLWLTGSLNLAYDLINNNEFIESENIIRDCIKIAKSIGDVENEADARSNLIAILIESKKYYQIIEQVNIIMDLVGEASWQASYTHADCAQANLGLGNYEIALDEARIGYSTAVNKHEDTEAIAYTANILAKIECKLSMVDFAIEHFNTAINIYKKEGNNLFKAKIMKDLAEFFISIGENKKGILLLKKSKKIFIEFDQKKDLEEIDKVLANV
jgi:predicted ATPase